ncbi:MAG: dephospho-CoA kinase [Bacteroidota bacterium]|nr:dephospho-CoA kinase [Bacteroidota bacterium]
MKIIGLTGGIGSGKSKILSVFSTYGIPCYESDRRAKWLMQRDAELKSQIKSFFGDQIYENDQFNQRKLAKLVFANKGKLEALNSLVHPRVKMDFKSFVSQQDTPYIIKEAAILFETGGEKDCDATILVTAPEKLRLQRVLNREKISSMDIKARINNQWSDSRKIPLADYVINNIDWDKTLKKIDEIHQKLLVLY